MKKNKALNSALCIFGLTMVSMCAIGGTFAKYVTTGTGTDSARVAKWGVEVTVESKLAKAFDGTVISANDEEDILAPGTSGELVSVQVSGTPEVSTSVSANADISLKGWEVDAKYYCPLIVTVNQTTLKGTDYDGAYAFETAIETAIEYYVKVDSMAPNTNLDTLNKVVATWSWPFEVDGNNEKDTALGNAGTASLVFSLDVTVSQVD